MSDPDFIVCDALPPGMRLAHKSVFADEPAPGGHIVDDGLPDFDLQLDEDGEIRATRT